MSMFESGFGGWGANQINASMGMGPGGAGDQNQALINNLYGSGGFGGTVGQYAPYPMFGAPGGAAGALGPAGQPQVSGGGGTKAGYGAGGGQRVIIRTPAPTPPPQTVPAASFQERYAPAPPVNPYLQYPDYSGVPPGIRDPKYFAPQKAPAAPAYNPGFDDRYGNWNQDPWGSTPADPFDGGSPFDPMSQVNAQIRASMNAMGGSKARGTPTPQARPPQAEAYYDPNTFNARYGTSSSGAAGGTGAYRDAISQALLRQQAASNSYYGGTNLYGSSKGSGTVGPRGDFATSYPYEGLGMTPYSQIQNRFPFGMSSVNAPNQQQIQGGINSLEEALRMIDAGGKARGSDGLTYEDIFKIIPGGA